MRLWAAAAAALVVAALTPAPVGGAVPVVVVDGRGFGHGVGMAQDGAFWMAKRGADTAAVLGHFYPGTVIARSTAAAEVRVLVLSAADAAVVMSFPDGGEVRPADGGAAEGFPVRVPPGGQVRVRYVNGDYVVDEGTDAPQSSPPPAPPAPDGGDGTGPSTTMLPGPGRGLLPSTTTTSTTSSTTSTTLVLRPASRPAAAEEATAPAPAPPVASGGRQLAAVPSGAGVVRLPSRQRSYRGVVELASRDGTLRAVNRVDVEQYLRGMGEVRDPSWPPAALRAQAVAARTYALRAMTANGELCDDQRCQVYLGSQAEYRAMDRAVADTRGQVLTFARRLAAAVYSANGGGYSATREEGFGTTGGDYPYLRATPYTTGDPRRWQVTVALADVGARLGYPGTLEDVWVSHPGPSGRAVEIALRGSAGPRIATGRAFARALGLRSTLFELTRASASAAPLPPAGGSFLQSLPDEVGDLGPLSVPLHLVNDGLTDAAVSPGRPAVPLPSAPSPPSRRPDRTAAAVAMLLVGAVAAATLTMAGERRWPATAPS